MESRIKIFVIAVLFLIPYTALTITRNREWRNLYDLYRKDIPYLTNSAKANTQYAGYLMHTTYTDPNFLQYGNVNMFKLEVMKHHYFRSLEIFPGNYQTLNDLGSVYLFFGKDTDSAILFLKKARDFRPDLDPAWVNLGMAYREKKEYDSAIVCYQTILRKNPSNIKAYFALANVHNDKGNFDLAVKMNQDVIRIHPELDVPYINIGNYFFSRADTAMAVRYWEEAVARRPTVEGCTQLCLIYKIRGDMERSAFYQQKAQEAAKQLSN